MRRYAWLLWLPLVVGLWALLAPRSLDTRGTASSAATQEAELGYSATGAELIETGVDGQPLYRLQAARISQPQPEAAIELTGPRLAYEQPVGRWTLQADGGTLSDDRRTAQFTGNVVGQRAQPKGAMLTLRTESLAVNLENHVADALQAVSLDWGRARINAAGLHADMQSNTFVLTGPGHGRLRY